MRLRLIPREERFFEAQVRLAMEHDLPVLVHTPHRNKKQGFIRSLEIVCTNPADTTTCSLVETGGYLSPEGNDFWGVEVLVRGDHTYVLGSDRDFGLVIVEDTPDGLP